MVKHRSTNLLYYSAIYTVEAYELRCVCVSLFCTLLQHSEMFSMIDAKEYISDLWKHPDPLTKENLSRFENVSYKSYD